MTGEKIACRGLSAGYGKKDILEDISLEVKAGEIVSLIGPNGAGKSTLLRALAGYIGRRGGTVCIDGKDEDAMSRAELSRTLSVTLTRHIRPELMTCREVVQLGRYPYTGRLGLLTRSDQEAVLSAMRDTATEDIAGEYFNAVSDGQRQRVILAKAIAQAPEILIMDEPTSYLDIRHKIEFFEILRRLTRERHMGVLISIHELAFARKISDRVLCIQNGRITDRGTPDEIFTPAGIMALYGLSQAQYTQYFG